MKAVLRGGVVAGLRGFRLCGLPLIGMILGACAGVVAPFIHNPYAGTYMGTFATSDGKAGPASVSLTNIGNVFGDLTDTKTKKVGKLTGSVNTDLVFNGKVVFDPDVHP